MVGFKKWSVQTINKLLSNEEKNCIGKIPIQFFSFLINYNMLEYIM